MEMFTIGWLILFIVMLAIEVVTLGLATIWFAGGALAAFIAAAIGMHLTVQIVLFFVVSFLLLYFTRPWAIQYVNKNRIKTNAESLVGQTAIVTQKINNLHGEGQVVVNGLEWTARAVDDKIEIAKDKKVSIIAIKGVKLIVEEKEEDI